MAAPSRPRPALLVVFVAQGGCFATLVTRIPTLRDRFGLDDLHLGIVLALVPLIAGIGSLAAGRIARRAGVVPVLRVATPVACAALPGVAVAASLPVLLGALAVFALALGAVDATMNAYGVALQRSAGRALMSRFHAAYSLGSILGSVTAAVAAARHLPLTVLFGVAGAAGGLALSRGRPPAGPGRRPGAGHRRDRRAPAVAQNRGIGAAVTGLFLVDSAVSNWGATYLRAVLGAPDHLAALAYGMYAAAALLGQIRPWTGSASPGWSARAAYWARRKCCWWSLPAHRSPGSPASRWPAAGCPWSRRRRSRRRAGRSRNSRPARWHGSTCARTPGFVLGPP